MIYLIKIRLGYNFGISIPETLVSDSIGICSSGCPSDQILGLGQIGRNNLKEIDPIIISRIPLATKKCKETFAQVKDEPTIIESRINACIYDLAVTGDDSVRMIFYVWFRHGEV